jgi:hypothetical protein
MQDGASPHTAKDTTRELRGVFAELNVDDRSRDLHLCICICEANWKILCVPTDHVTCKL